MCLRVFKGIQSHLKHLDLLKSLYPNACRQIQHAGEKVEKACRDKEHAGRKTNSQEEKEAVKEAYWKKSRQKEHQVGREEARNNKQAVIRSIQKSGTLQSLMTSCL